MAFMDSVPYRHGELDEELDGWWGCWQCSTMAPNRNLLGGQMELWRFLMDWFGGRLDVEYWSLLFVVRSAVIALRSGTSIISGRILLKNTLVEPGLPGGCGFAGRCYALFGNGF